MVAIVSLIFAVATANAQPLSGLLAGKCHDDDASSAQARIAAWKKMGLPHPCQFLKRLRYQGATRARAIEDVQRTYALSSAGAEALIAVQEQLLAYRRLPYDQYKIKKPELLRFVDTLFAAAPQSALPWMMFLTDSDLRNWDDSVFAKLSSNPQNMTPAILLLPALSALSFGAEDVAAYVLKNEPAEALRVLRGFGFDQRYDEATATYLRLAELTSGELSTHDSARLAARLIRNLVDSDRYRLAAEIFQRSPAVVREAIERGGVQIWGRDRPPDEGRVALALTLFDQGDSVTATRIFSSLPPPPLALRRARADPDSLRALNNRAVLGWLIDENSRPRDRFDLLVSIIEDGDDAPLTLRMGVFGDEYAHVFQAKYAYHLNYRDRRDDSSPLRAALAEQFALLEAADAAELDRIRPLFPANTELREEVSSISAPRVWTEKNLPPEIEPAPATDSATQPISPLQLPKGFWPVRVELLGTRVLVIAASQAVDPTGEVSGGGYWLFDSADGKRWRSRIYTGLREYRPYVLTPTSRLPILADNGLLQVEVRIREVDDDKLTFPPVCVETKREASGLYVESSLQRLTADSDLDGLSDLLEMRLMLDPRSPDSDGDGMRDGVDPLPNVSATGRANSPDAALLESVLLTVRDGAPAIMTGALARKGDAPMALRGTALSPSDSVTFIVGDPAKFRGVDAPNRTIVLTPEQLSRAHAMFGEFYPLQIKFVMKNARGDRVFIEYSERWRGGSLEGTLKHGRWELHELDSWIT